MMVISHYVSIFRTAKECPKGLVYSDCVSPCPRTCQSLHNVMPESCTKECVSGCECPPGKFMQDGACIEPKECQCEYNHERFDNGDDVRVGCNKWYTNNVVMFFFNNSTLMGKCHLNVIDISMNT